MHKHQVRIQSDGTGKSTVITLSDGTVIPGVTGLWVSIDPNEVNRVDLTVSMPHLDVHAHPSEITFECIFCKESLTHECKDGDTI